MNYYEIWFNLKDSHRDLEFCGRLAKFLDRLVEMEAIVSYRLTRRKLGFGPPELGEFHVSMAVRDLAQLDLAFGGIIPRSGELERLHAQVYAAVTDFRSALYRDFPDPQRVESASPSN